mgnify:FL=1
MILKIILLTIQAICLLIWGFSIIIGIQRISEMIIEENIKTCVWWVAVFVVMVGTFDLTMRCNIHFSILCFVVGILAFLIDVYILWEILLTTGIMHSSEPMRCPLLKSYAIYSFFLLVLLYCTK